MGAALSEVMGQTLSDLQIKCYRELTGWKDTDLLDFRTWCGLSALCERLLGHEFMSIPSQVEDPCHEVEQADFETLPRRLIGLNPDPHLTSILNGIRDL